MYDTDFRLKNIEKSNLYKLLKKLTEEKLPMTK